MVIIFISIYLKYVVLPREERAVLMSTQVENILQEILLSQLRDIVIPVAVYLVSCRHIFY